MGVTVTTVSTSSQSTGSETTGTETTGSTGTATTVSTSSQSTGSETTGTETTASTGTVYTVSTSSQSTGSETTEGSTEIDTVTATTGTETTVSTVTVTTVSTSSQSTGSETTGTETTGSTGTEYTGSTCVTASAEIVELIHELNANLTDVRAQIEETFTSLMNCAGNIEKLEEASNLADVLDALVVELRDIIAKLENMRGSTRRMMISSLFSVMGSMTSKMRGLCAIREDDFLGSLRHLTRAIRTMKYEPESQSAQDSLACSSRQALKQMTKVIQGSISLSSEESLRAQKILAQLVTRDVQQVKSAVTQHTRANNALHERLQDELKELQAVQMTTEQELAKVHAESSDRLRAAGCRN